MRDEREREVAGLIGGMSGWTMEELLSGGMISMDELIRYEGINDDIDDDEDEEEKENRIRIRNEEYKNYVPFRDDEKTSENGFDLDF